MMRRFWAWLRRRLGIEDLLAHAHATDQLIQSLDHVSRQWNGTIPPRVLAQRAREPRAFTNRDRQ